jgi:hypothetical protein
MSPVGKHYKRRGKDYDGCEGKWISLEESKKYSVARDEWWKHPKCQDILNQIAYNDDDPTPVWLYDTNDMYIGSWKLNGPHGHPVEHGKGIFYYNFPKTTFSGLIYAGEWKNGYLHGHGESFWHELSDTWVKNRLRNSVVKENKKNGVCIPFHYRGTFINDTHWGPDARVTLKDGTVRVGPWRNGYPVGNFYKDHHDPFHPPNHQINGEIADDDPQVDVVSHEIQEVTYQCTSRNNNTHTTKQPHKKQKVDHVACNPKYSHESHSDGNQMNEDDDPLADDEPTSSLSDYHCTKIKYPTKSGDVRLAKQSNVEQINHYLANIVFNGNLTTSTVYNYALRLFDTGFESVNCIQKNMTEEHLRSFDWMNPLHKEYLETIVLPEKQRSIKELCTFLDEYVFKHCVMKATAHEYAKKIFSEGYHCVEYIKRMMKEERIKGFDWMHPLHKEDLIARLKPFQEEQQE